MRQFTMVVALLAVTIMLAGERESSSVSAGVGSHHVAQAARPDAVDPTKLELIIGKAGLDEETGFVKIAGEVRNNTGEWIEATRIDVDLLDAQGKSLAVQSIPTAVAKDLGREGALDSVYADRHFVPPGEVTPFFYRRDVKKIGGSYASHKLSASARRVSASEAPRVSIEKLSKEKDADGAYTVTGVIKNAGTVGCRSPEVILSVYDAAGRLFDVRTEQPDAYFQKILPSGESVAFTMKVWDSEGGPIGDIRATADCEPID